MLLYFTLLLHFKNSNGRKRERRNRKYWERKLLEKKSESTTSDKYEPVLLWKWVKKSFCEVRYETNMDLCWKCVKKVGIEKSAIIDNCEVSKGWRCSCSDNWHLESNFLLFNQISSELAEKYRYFLYSTYIFFLMKILLNTLLIPDQIICIPPATNKHVTYGYSICSDWVCIIWYVGHTVVYWWYRNAHVTFGIYHIFCKRKVSSFTFNLSNSQHFYHNFNDTNITIVFQQTNKITKIWKTSMSNIKCDHKNLSGGWM